ncbi:Hypothetical protein R9X50_00613300 [Acrodontium crateriforme]|uniref:NUDE domain-containing protein n=1 Tax=Acrodontium crateriforme TaxID=150365 RepID=A0AAQ3RBF3_9PEZI|nr:Hypothetical protein R9X50_00613300 [Acrodontium crateriforme]
MSSSPLRPGASLTDELDYYKKQYEQLETDLADFQASSKELEEQLERDIEAAEKNERRLREQAEKLGFEVEEWKAKHKQAKAEANSAQNALQKEITTMRESNRAMQLKLRDIEVMNDDYERQARNTESSLEDLESKYNVAIERSVLLDEEMRIGEQEREALRIETQRLRDELGDLKVESEITQEKLRLAEATVDRLRSRKPSPLAVETLRTRSPGSEASGITASSPTASTPPPKSDTTSEAHNTPPSPPLSDAPLQSRLDSKPPTLRTRRSFVPEPSATPRPSLYGARTAPKHSRGNSITSSSTATSDARSMLSTGKLRLSSRPSFAPDRVPRSDSLYQIKQLRGRMQKIEERVHSARSKLPAPSNTTPRGSPRAASPRTVSVTGEFIPSSITIRRQSRVGGSLASSVHSSVIESQESDSDHRPTDRSTKRLSFGIPRPVSSVGTRDPERPTSVLDRPSSALDRPSTSSRQNNGSLAMRPPSRGGYISSTAGSNLSSRPPPSSGVPVRPRSSLGGSTMRGSTPHLPPPQTSPTRRQHRPSASVSELRRLAAETEDTQTSPTRRKTLERAGLGILPVSHKPLAPPALRRQVSGLGVGEMRPPPIRRKAEDVGETY